MVIHRGEYIFNELCAFVSRYETGKSYSGARIASLLLAAEEEQSMESKCRKLHRK